MERRKAPSSYARRTFIAFESGGAIGFGIGSVGALALHYFRPNSPIWMYSLIFGAGFVAFLLLYARLQPAFKCPQCGRELGDKDRLGTVDGEPIRFVCYTCQIEWDTGMTVARGD